MSEAATAGEQTRWLVYLIYVQAIFLGLTYFVGTWSTLLVHEFAVNVPEVIGHGIASSGFAVMTGVVAFFAALQGQRRVSAANSGLFIVTILAGSTGFLFLGNPSDATQITVTNFSMMATIAAGMLVTGYSLGKVSRVLTGATRNDRSPTAIMTYLAFGALSMTIVVGAAVPGPPFLYALLVTAHVGFAALTVALVLGLLVISLFEGLGVGNPSSLEPQKVAYPVLALGSVSIAGADGVMYLNSGDLSYAVVMAEVAILAYSFLMITSTAQQNVKLWRRNARGREG